MKRTKGLLSPSTSTQSAELQKLRKKKAQRKANKIAKAARKEALDLMVGTKKEQKDAQKGKKKDQKDHADLYRQLMEEFEARQG